MVTSAIYDIDQAIDKHARQKEDEAKQQQTKQSIIQNHKIEMQYAADFDLLSQISTNSQKKPHNEESSLILRDSFHPLFSCLHGTFTEF